MKKVKKIVDYVSECIIQMLGIIVIFTVATIIPYSAIMVIARAYDDTLRHLPIDQRIIMLVLILWICDLIIRPIVKEIMTSFIEKSKKLFLLEPIKEGTTNARDTATTAKDA